MMSSSQVLALDLLHHRRVRHEEGVVLVLAGRRLPLDPQHADDPARLAGDAHGLAQRLLFAKQLIDDGLAEHAGRRRALDVGLVEHPALDDGPGFHLQVFRRDAADRRVPVLVAVDELHARIDHWRGVRDERHLLADGAHVGEGEALGRTRSGPHAAAVDAAGFDPDDVGADARDGLLDLRRRAVADGDGADHRADADDDAEHRQRRAHGVPPQRLQCEWKDEEQPHDGPAAVIPRRPRGLSSTRAARTGSNS